jgi:hypothetical protein
MSNAAIAKFCQMLQKAAKYCQTNMYFIRDVILYINNTFNLK